MKYEIVHKERNTVRDMCGRAYLETTRWSDVQRWFRSHKCLYDVHVVVRPASRPFGYENALYIPGASAIGKTVRDIKEYLAWKFWGNPTLDLI